MSRFLSFLVCCVLIIITANVVYSRSLDEILSTGVLRVGTTGDYKPFSFNNNGNYEGFDIAVAKSFASKLGVKLELVKTSWPALMGDLKEGKYDIGMSGITRTVSRQKEARFSKGYVMFGKTPLVAASNTAKYSSLADIDKKGVKIGVNPGGTNEKFVKANIQNAEVVLYQSNLAIPKAVAAQEVDVMITDSVEALYYAAIDSKLNAPLANKPFTRAELGYLMSAGAERLQDTVNFMMDQMVLKGEMAALKQEYLHMVE